MRLATPALLLSALLVLGTGAAHAVPGNLDPAFGTAGVARASLGSSDSGEAIALQRDGKIVVAGSALKGISWVFALARFSPDGSLDRSFGAGGTTTTAFATDAYAHAVALQPDGKIVVVGQVSYSTLALARYRPDGSLDPSFGSGGKLMLSIGDSSFGYGIAIEPDGKIVIVGAAAVGNSNGFAVVRLNPNGSPDPGFGSNGVTITKIDEGSGAWAVALQPDGKIVAAGYSAQTIGFSRFAVARYDAQGSLDVSFGVNGTVTTPGHEYGGLANALAVQPDGKIVVAGNDSSRGLALFRLTRDGALDSAFGSGGTVLTELGDSSEADGVVLQPDGKLVVAGRAPIGAISGIVVARYDAAGGLDPTFGRGGVVVSNLSSMPKKVVSSTASGVALQLDGKIVVGGTVQTLGGRGGPTFGVARYLVTPGCRVPDVRHRKLPDAKAAISRSGCRVGTIRRTYSRDVARGRVISQRPAPRTGLPEAGNVSLVVSKGRHKR